MCFLERPHVHLVLHMWCCRAQVACTTYLSHGRGRCRPHRSPCQWWCFLPGEPMPWLVPLVTLVDGYGGVTLCHELSCPM
jgi:hypothetical protein